MCWSLNIGVQLEQSFAGYQASAEFYTKGMYVCSWGYFVDSE